jgi:hypothetical protein
MIGVSREVGRLTLSVVHCVPRTLEGRQVAGLGGVESVIHFFFIA